MRFSIATPTFNCLHHLKRCIGSIRNQSGVDVEHLVQDGGSGDGTPEWLKSQPGVKSISMRDAGMYDAINRAWDRGSGDVYAWLNADEQYLPGTLEHVAKFFDAHPDIDMVFGDTLLVDGAGRLIAARREIPLRSWYIKNGFLYSLSCSLFFRARLRDKGMLKFDTRYRLAGDLDLVLRLLDHGATCRHVSHYYALFGVDGGNLSLNPRMEQEGAEIQRRFGGFDHRWLRAIPKACRFAERAVRGCYLTDKVSYAYTLDETGRQEVFDRIPAGFRFTYQRALSRMNKP